MADGGLVDPVPTPERVLEREEMRRMVEEAIQGLPVDYRIVVVLRDLHDLSYREIAEAADLSVEVIKTRLMRARRMLRRKLEHYLV
jgi:RNA polymerase sigma-70 factor (ECF subfamily)